MEFNSLIDKANLTYQKHFPPTTNFERAIFFSWYCSIRDCAFCFMSVNPEKYTKQAIRHPASILAEVLLTKNLGWDLGFFSGGINAYTSNDFLTLIKQVSEVQGESIWLNIGPIPKPTLEKYAPYIKGVVGSIETINPELHKKICPSKPIAPYEHMFNTAQELGLKKAMTMIVGMGETKQDFKLLSDFIRKHQIDKIHIYSLVPQKRTIFEHTEQAHPEYHAWWIAQVRINFPKIDIQAGIWKDRAHQIPLLLSAGANSISKFPALRLFGSKRAEDIEHQIVSSGRKFKGTLTKLPEINWEKKIGQLPVKDKLKQEIKSKLQAYLNKMEKNLKESAESI
jgi:biotin synthase-like enzyme